MAVVISLDQKRERVSETALDHLTHMVAADLTQVNEIILQRMESPVALIPQLAGHIIAAGGKRLRPLLTLASARRGWPPAPGACEGHPPRRPALPAAPAFDPFARVPRRPSVATAAPTPRDQSSSGPLPSDQPASNPAGGDPRLEDSAEAGRHLAAAAHARAAQTGLAPNVS